MEEALTKTREVKKLGKTAAERVTARQLGDGGGERRGEERERRGGVKRSKSEARSHRYGIGFSKHLDQ